MMTRILHNFWFCFCLFGLLVVVPFLGAAETPEFKRVPMEQLRIRDGVGNVLEKLNKGETVKIAYLGGSITAANGWRPKTTEWFKTTFPKAKIEEIHAAIGGTGSNLGVFRVRRDVLRFQPDLLFVEFAVNDGGESPENIWRSMEGIVRQTWKTNPKIDIVFVYTLSEALAKEPREGFCNRSMSSMELLADFYGIPSINFAVPVLALEKAGKLLFKGESAPEGVILFSTDSVHPLDAGHQIYAQTVADSFEKMKETKPVLHQDKLDKTFIADHWEAAQLVPITESMLKGEWKKLDTENGLQKSFGQRLGEIWYSGQPGSQLTFRFKG
ncbi:MAG: SGNH/GDSL hydrolase family protein, partial [Planctomycetaceae bacterium]|nr:SGNH/GDSL hydrolase family protein [Planctomycetaceae bacterium]